MASPTRPAASAPAPSREGDHAASGTGEGWGDGRRGGRSGGATVPDAGGPDAGGPEAAPAYVRWADVARRPRMIALLALFLGLAAICGTLGAWQLDRAYERGARSEQAQLDQRLAQEAADGPRGLGTVLVPQTTFLGRMIGELVDVEGTYEAGSQVLVPGRALDGRTGYLVVTPLRVTDDGTGGASWADLSGPPVVAVVRGWVAQPSDAAASPPPGGPVRVVGYLQASEATDPGNTPLPDGQVDSVSSAQLANRWGGPIYGGYVVLTTSEPAQAAGLALLPRPVAEGSGSVNLQSLSYAFQWWLFAAFAVFVWWRVVRDQRDSENAALAVAEAPQGSASGTAASGTLVSGTAAPGTLASGSPAPGTAAPGTAATDGGTTLGGQLAVPQAEAGSAEVSPGTEAADAVGHPTRAAGETHGARAPRRRRPRGGGDDGIAGLPARR